MNARLRWARTAPLTAIMIVAALAVAEPASAAGSATRGYVVDRPDTVRVFDPATGMVTGSIPIPGAAVGIFMRPGGAEAYIAGANAAGSTSVAVISTATDRVVATVRTGDRPVDVSFTPNGQRAYVAHVGGTVAVVDTQTRQVVQTIRMNGPAFSVAVSPDGSRVYAGTVPGPARTVVVINPATGRITKTIQVSPNTTVERITFAPNGRIAVVQGSRDVIDTATDSLSGTMPVSAGPIAFTPDSARIYAPVTCGDNLRGVIDVIDVASRTRINTVRTGGNPFAVTITSDGRRVYAALAGTGSVAVIDTATNQILDTFGAVAPTQESHIADIAISETAPALQPGRRFAPSPVDTRLCSPV